ncbi:MAG: glycosyltransferase family 9 protein [Phycisphaerales bacterium]
MAGTPQRILIVRPSALGDVCRSVPVLASLRRAFPAAQIDWLVQDTFAEAISAHPALSGVVVFDRRRFGRWASPASMGALARWLRNLGRANYDLVLDCQGLLRSAIFTQATGAPRRIGHADARELAWAAYTDRVPPGSSPHTVDRMLQLAAAAGAPAVPDMRLYAPAAAAAVLFDREPRLASGPLVIVAPTSRWPGKRWPAARFAEVTRGMIAGARRGGPVVAVVGGARERDQCKPLLDLAATEPRVVDLVGRTTVGELLALIERASLVLANDSAAVHMAVGFNRPLVAIYGPTDIARVGPYGRTQDVLSHTGPGDTLDHKDAERGLMLMERVPASDVLRGAMQRLGPQH